MPPTLTRRASAALRLTRWDDHLLFTAPATLLGVVAALHRTGADLDGRALLVLAANALAVTFAFMINDVEDAPDDARDPARGARNAVASGQIGRGAAWRLTLAAGAAALALFALAGPRVLAVGALTTALGGLYSWRPVRLKARPALDVIAHVLMLAALLFGAGYAVYAADWRGAWSTAAALALISAYGQLYNQLRDFDADQLAGLRNTASLLGRRATQRAMRLCLGAGGALLAASVAWGRLPLSLAGLIVLLAPLALLLRSHADMRGSPALDAAAGLQTGAMLIATLALALWLGVYAIQ